MSAAPNTAALPERGALSLDHGSYQRVLADIARVVQPRRRQTQKRVLAGLDQLEKKYGGPFYTGIFELLTYISLKPKEAEYHWRNVKTHLNYLSAMMRRDVGLRVAILDYFTNINSLMKSPVLVEIALFKQVQVNAMTDPLTGLYNRRFFQSAIHREFERAARYKEPLSVIFFDLDNFKNYNDVNGHIQGDVLLKRVGAIFTEQVREVDIVCRYGGEEFVVICPETMKNKTLVLAERIRSAVETEAFKGERHTNTGEITISGGIASFPVDTEDMEELLRMADQALYRSKNTQKNTITLFYGEKRDFIRIARELVFDFKTVSGDYINKKLGKTKNISKGGALFSCREQMRVGTQLEVKFYLAGRKRPLVIFSRVVRVEEAREEGGEGFDIGICFIGLSPRAQKHLLQLIKE